MAEDRRRDDDRIQRLEKLAAQAAQDHHEFRAQLADLTHWRASMTSRVLALEHREDRLFAVMDEKHAENQEAIRALTDGIAADRTYTRGTMDAVNARLGQNNEALSRIDGGYAMIRWGIATIIAVLTVVGGFMALAG